MRQDGYHKGRTEEIPVGRVRRHPVRESGGTPGSCSEADWTTVFGSKPGGMARRRFEEDGGGTPPETVDLRRSFFRPAQTSFAALPGFIRVILYTFPAWS